MSLKLRAGTVLFAAIGLVLAPVLPASADPVDDKEKEIEEEWHDLEAVIEDYNLINEEFQDTKEKIEKLEKELKPFEDELNVLYGEVAQIATHVYMGGSMSGISAMLTSGSPETLADRLTALDQLTADDAAVIAELNEAKADLDEQKALLDDLYAEQKAQNDELEEKKTQIEDDLERLQEEREEVYRDERGTGPDGFVPPYVPGPRGDVIDFALDQNGDTYVWGAGGPDQWDCSGLTMGAWQQAGVSLPHNARAQHNQMTKISRDQLQPGDLVFYNDLTHVAMYIGEGYVVHAAIHNEWVKIDTIDGAASDYYGQARVPGW